MCMSNLSPEAEKTCDTLLAALRDVSFIHPPSDNARQVAQAIRRGNPKALNVYQLGTRWAVKYVFAGRQRSFGFFDLWDADSAYRLADLIIHRFSDLRRRKPKPITDESFNLPRSQMQADLANEPEINSILIQIHSLAPEKRLRAKQIRKTARGEFEKMRSDLGRIETLLLDVNKRVEALLDLTQPKQMEPLQTGSASRETIFSEACFGSGIKFVNS